MDGWKETEVGKIPINWKILLFPKFVILQRGKDLTKVNFKAGNVPVAGSSGIIGYHDTSFVKAPGVTVGRSGSCGRVKFYETDFWAHNTSLYVKDFNGNDELFSYFYLLYLDVGRYKTGASVPTLDRNSLNTIKIPLPPPPEQRQIAHVLTTVQKAIEQQDKLIRTTTELKKALMQKLFTEGTRGESQKETEIGLVPKSWEVVRIEKYILKTKNRDPRKEPEKDFIYVDVSSVSSEFFRIENTSKISGKEAPSRARKKIQDGDVIFATVRPTLKRIAKISQNYHNQICSTGYCVLKPDPDKLSQEYLYQYLQTDFFIEGIEKLQRGASYPAVRDTDVKNMYIPFPKLSEQK